MKKCAKCRYENSDDTVFCVGCGSSIEQNKATLWLILNIITTVISCPAALFTCVGVLGTPVAIIGIIFAAMGIGSYNKGDYADMKKKAKVAMIMFIIGIISSTVLPILVIVLSFAFPVLLSLPSIR